ncbi:pheromone shutdown-related protein TraB [Archaeoglobus sulfaticallidus PM70-1]|uniref:Pheromone shutdown-related protein TraB n=1 Tax=Archaeoglobus sulfaticallidus PM70-1 TaxID=387631 RepID=N0BDV9_9EURY|nr:TraB/GumN family protein [Archaeoglobus sulfaticallidus]AGK61814.1 pheromone shutdown-related protein TraB [Archaeoglobus sulfaticallidus PM70-1]
MNDENIRENIDERIILVGTAHVSKKSIEQVKETILSEKPDAVAIELDEKRFFALVHKKAQEISIVDVIKRGETHLLLFQLLLSYFQRKVGEKYGVTPGEEMLKAIEVAKEVGADILLIDRDISITFKRFWSSLSFIEKVKLFVSLIVSLFHKEEIEVDELLKEDIITAMVSEFEKISPNAVNALIKERDTYMAGKLLQFSKRYNKIVAVVGAGHVNGIKEKLKGGEIPDLDALLEVKQSRFNLAKTIGYSIFAFVAIIFISVLLSLNTELILKAFIYWFLINGILSALGALLARGSPLSILSAFLFAWLTSLNPAIAAGWISGIVEAWVRKPTSKDLEKLSEARSIRDLLDNKFFRVLLVAALTNLGSMIGTFIGIYAVLNLTGIDITEILKNRIASMIHF